MTEYTVQNLKQDVEDSAPKFGYAPDMEARFAAGALGLERSAISYQRLAPNFRQPFGHRHSQQEELYVVVGGSGRLKLDDEIVELKTWDAVRISPEVARCLQGGPDGVEILAIGAPNVGTPEVDPEPLPGWWTD